MRPIRFPLLVLLLTFPCRAGEEQNLSLKALADAGAQTANRFAAEPSSWQTVHAINGGEALLSFLHTPTRERIIFSIESRTGSREVLRLVRRDEQWLVHDKKGYHKYRPFELPTEDSLFYICLLSSRPEFFQRADEQSRRTFKEIVGKTAAFVAPLPEGTADTLRKSIADIDTLLAQNPGAPSAASLRARQARAQLVLETGSPIKIDTETGLILSQGLDRFRTEFREFSFLPQIPDGEFKLESPDWDDYTTDPTADSTAGNRAGHLDDLLMIGHSPAYQPGSRDYELDGRLFDLSTGKFRRIPFQGPVCLPECFLPGRKSVIVNGMDIAHGSLRPFRIDLSTGENHPLGGEALDYGFTVGGDLSPDGEAVVVGSAGLHRRSRNR
jgi:hypothetical protein